VARWEQGSPPTAAAINKINAGDNDAWRTHTDLAWYRPELRHLTNVLWRPLLDSSKAMDFSAEFAYQK
jgi:hypothetical protein